MDDPETHHLSVTTTWLLIQPYPLHYQSINQSSHLILEENEHS